MSRLQTQLHRLYHPQPASSSTSGLASGDLVDGQGRTRAMVLSLCRPADWDTVVRVWEGVQADLNLPAPAIAVNGKDGYQLWFSTSAPLDLPQAHAFLSALQAAYWADIPVARIRIWPAPASDVNEVHATPVPTLLDDTGQWSAFVARDLAPVFTDGPWLDIPPNPDGQADLLTPLRCITPDDLQAAMTMLSPATDRPNPDALAGIQPGHAVTPLTHAPGPQDPRRFLQDVMNNPTVDLALRIEAAKALLSTLPPSPN
ncbi:MAG TPA: hypothetical protein H9903_16900 [Candidatus Aquabacterium excrementipullorum]|nr:hypothetical protein [Candidatus Aquabacterium excrementipullorum]